MSTWYRRGVFYRMYPLRMTGALKHNGATEVTNHFEELDRWIPHIRSLGCSAIYTGPVFELTSHGYDTRGYRLMDRRLGDNDSSRNFMTQCHREGIGIIMDGVFDYMGHEFLASKDIQKKRRDPPCRDWYKKVNLDWQNPCGNSFGYEAWQGHPELPCLNLLNPDVRPHLFDIIRFWIDKFDIDRIRLDYVNVLDFNFMKEMRSRTKIIKGDSRLMGEVIHGDYSRWVNSEVFHSVANYGLHKSLCSGLNDHNSFEIAHNAGQLETIGRRLYTFVDNHGEDRIVTKFSLRGHLFPVYLRLFTLFGIPSVYYDGKWGIEGKRTNTNDEALRLVISIDQKGEPYCELTDLIAQLGQIHRRQEALHTGRYQELLLTNRQYVSVRYGEDSVTIATVNSDGEPASLSVPAPIQASKTVNLLEPGDHLPISDGKVHIRLKGNRRTVLRSKREN